LEKQERDVNEYESSEDSLLMSSSGNFEEVGDEEMS
jgi:hypothetical protein